MMVLTLRRVAILGLSCTRVGDESRSSLSTALANDLLKDPRRRSVVLSECNPGNNGVERGVGVCEA